MPSTPLNLASDNVTAPAPEVFEALRQACDGPAMPYGNDPWTERFRALVRETFETDDVEAFPVATGSAANSLALATLAPPWGVIYCHRKAHIEEDECGAPEFYTGGAKLTVLDGGDGRIAPEALETALAGAGAGVVHHAQPAAVSLTNATEAGSVYGVDQVAALTEIARRHGLPVHMDGARLANALASAGCAPADMTWRAGVDVLSLGATKNGAIGAEAVLFFGKGRADGFEFRRKRGGHLFSKMRFVSAQLVASLEDGRWLTWGGRANAAARRLAEGLRAIDGVRVENPVEANILFARLPAPVHRALQAAGHVYYVMAEDAAGTVSIRLVCAHDTTPEAVDGFLADARRGVGQAAE